MPLAIVWVLLSAVLTIGCASSPPPPAIVDGEITYGMASDYVAFVGWDDGGQRAAAVIDNNRGRDGRTLDGQLLCTLWIEGEGLLAPDDTGLYQPATFLDPPDALGYRYQGNLAGGLTIVSEPNALRVEVAPAEWVREQTIGLARYAAGSAPASLTWAGRHFQGRAAVEQIVAPGTNPLADPNPLVVPRFTTMWATSRAGDEGAWGVFEGSGAKRLGIEAAPPPRGAWTRSSSQAPALLDTFHAEAIDRSTTFGAFTWPQTWRMAAGDVSLTTRTLARDDLFWWGYGGFAFVVVEGELTIDGASHEVLGIAEVLEYWR